MIFTVQGNIMERKNKTEVANTNIQIHPRVIVKVSFKISAKIFTSSSDPINS